MESESSTSELVEISPFDNLESEGKKKKPRVRKTLVSVMENKLNDIDQISKKLSDFGSENNAKVQKLIDDFDKFRTSCNEKLRYLYEEIRDLKKK